MRQHVSGRSRRAVALVAGSLATVLVLGACTAGTQDADNQADGPPRSGGSITVGLESESDSLLPGAATFPASTRNVAMTIYDPLMARTTDGEVEPFLAESLTPNQELTEWTLALRPGVTFHDGTKLDAGALKTVFDDYLTADGSTVRGDLTDAEELIQMEVVDDLTVKYLLPRANAAFPAVLTTEAGWPFSPTAAKKAGKNAGSNPVGTGPFVFTSWQRDNRLVVKKNPDYWRKGMPYLDEIVFRPMPDEDTRLTSLQAGDIDAMITLRQSIVGQLKDAAEGGQVQTFEHTGDNAAGSLFNVLVPPVDDVRVRQALTHAVDQDDLIAVLGGTDISPKMTQIFHPDSPWYSKNVAEAYPAYEPGKAEELLDDYINDPERSDGKPVGSPVSVDYQCLPDPSLLELSQTYQAAWKKLGVEVDLKQLDQATNIATVVGEAGSQQPFSGDYMVACWRFGAEPDPWLEMAGELGPLDGALNFSNYRHPEIDAALDQMRTTADLTARTAAAETISMHLAEAVPWTYAGSTVQAVGMSSQLRNFKQIELPSGNAGAPLPELDGTVVYWPQLWLDQ